MGKIKAKIILEIAGYPQKYVEDTMAKVVEKVSNDKELKLEDQEIFPVEQKEETFATFAELTISFKKLIDIYEFCFNYMPSSIDIIEPSDNLNIEPNEFNDGINDLIATIHQHDMFLKNSNANLKLLSANMNKLLLNFYGHLKKEGKKIKEIETIIGIKSDKLKEFVKDIKEAEKNKK